MSYPEESVNDTYLSAWNAMPTHWPEQLAAFLGKITRNLSFNKYKFDHAQKRGCGEIVLVLDELADCVSGIDNVEQEIDCRELVKAAKEPVKKIINWKAVGTMAACFTVMCIAVGGLSQSLKGYDKIIFND